MMETRTRGKGTIDHGLRGSVGTLADANPTRLSKRSQGCPLTVCAEVSLLHSLPTTFCVIVSSVLYQVALLPFYNSEATVSLLCSLPALIYSNLSQFI